MLDKNTKVILHLSLISGVGSGMIKTIVRGVCSAFGDTSLPDLIKKAHLEDFYTFHESDFVRCCGLTEKQAHMVVAGLGDVALLERELTLLKKHEIQLLSLADDAYPTSLGQIHVPPFILYFKGASFNEQEKCLAIVGARKAGRYAQHVTDYITTGLVDNGWTIVSGGAWGVDAMAHRVALKAGGRTVVVLGSGLLQPYPKEHVTLFDEVIAAGGTIVSPFSLTMMAQKGTFPARNRIIAGLSLGCLVVAAGEKSGSLITAEYALQEGRGVFAIPGPINEELSAGCHHLIKQGAKLVHVVNDVLEEFGERESEKGSKQPLAPVPKSSNPVVVALDIPKSMDELSCLLKKDIFTLQGELFDLQIEGKIKQNFAGLWERM